MQITSVSRMVGWRQAKGFQRPPQYPVPGHKKYSNFIFQSSHEHWKGILYKNYCSVFCLIAMEDLNFTDAEWISPSMAKEKKECDLFSPGMLFYFKIQIRESKSWMSSDKTTSSCFYHLLLLVLACQWQLTRKVCHRTYHKPAWTCKLLLPERAWLLQHSQWEVTKYIFFFCWVSGKA